MPDVYIFACTKWCQVFYFPPSFRNGHLNVMPTPSQTMIFQIYKLGH